MLDGVRYRVLLNVPHEGRSGVVPIETQINDIVSTG